MANTEAGGEYDRTRALYIKLRLAQIAEQEKRAEQRELATNEKLAEQQEVAEEQRLAGVADFRKLVALRQIRDVIQKDLDRPRTFRERCVAFVRGKFITSAALAEFNAILAKYEYANYPHRKSADIDDDIAALEIDLRKKQLNPNDHQTTAELTAVYEIIKVKQDVGPKSAHTKQALTAQQALPSI